MYIYALVYIVLDSDLGDLQYNELFHYSSTLAA